jgi:hypothetical protein
VRHVITLSTIPPRFAAIGPALTSLLDQTSRPEAVELYIPRTYRRFPQWGGALPEVPDGVRIVRVDEDLGPATKILPAARAYLGQAVELVYVDDDRVYARDWVQQCLTVRRAHPEAAICGVGFNVQERYGYRFAERRQPLAVVPSNAQFKIWFLLRKIANTAMPDRRQGLRLTVPLRRFDVSGYTHVAEGFGGVMVRPEFFDDEAHVIPPVLWAVDDVWLSGQMERRGIPIWGDQSLYNVRLVIEASQTSPLYRSVIDGADRNEANRACIDYMRETYGIWGGVAVQST